MGSKVGESDIIRSLYYFVGTGDSVIFPSYLMLCECVCFSHQVGCWTSRLALCLADVYIRSLCPKISEVDGDLCSSNFLNNYIQ